MPETNITGLILDHAKRRPDARFGVAEAPVTLADAVARARRTAAALGAADVAPGTRVAVVGETSTSYLLTWMALVFAGAEPALINPTYPADLLEEMLADLEPAAVVWLHREPDATVAEQRPPPRCQRRRRRPPRRRRQRPGGRERRGRRARARPPAPRRRRLHAHLRHDRRPQVLHPDPRVLPAAGPVHRRLDVPLAGRHRVRAAADVPHQPTRLRRDRRPHRWCRGARHETVLRQWLLAAGEGARRHGDVPARATGRDPQAGDDRIGRRRTPSHEGLLRRRRVPRDVRHPAGLLRLRLHRGRRAVPHLDVEDGRPGGHRRGHVALRRPGPPRRRLGRARRR